MMNSVLKTVAVFSVIAALAACAQKPNVVKPAPNAPAKQDGLDKLQGLSAADTLKAKYKSLSVNCELKAVDTPVAANAVAAAVESSDPTTPPPPVPQPVVDGLKLSYDIVEQAKADATLSKVLKATMKSADEKTIVSLILKPVEFVDNSSERAGSVVRLRKHSPTLVILASVNDATDDLSKTINPVVPVQLSESAPLDTVIRSSTAGNVKTDLVLGCKLEGEIVDTYKNQNMDIDCATDADKEPTEERKAAHKANCQPPVANPAPAQ